MIKLASALWFILLISKPPSAVEMAPGVLRTPDEQFSQLVDFPMKPQYLKGRLAIEEQFVGAISLAGPEATIIMQPTEALWTPISIRALALSPIAR